MRNPWVAMVAVAAGGAALSSCLSESCTLIGCGYVAELRVASVDVGDEAMLAGASLRVCVNDQCVTAPLPPVPTSIGTGFSTPIQDGELWVDASIFRREAGRYEVSAAVQETVATPADGDHYTAELFDATGALILSRSWTAQYSEYEPNGEACGPACPQAELTDAL